MALAEEQKVCEMWKWLKILYMYEPVKEWMKKIKFLRKKKYHINLLTYSITREVVMFDRFKQ